MNIIIIAASVILIPVLWVSIVRLIWEERIVPDEVHFAPTADGYEIALYRFRPSYINPRREPVILCHGFGSNHVSWIPGPCPSFLKHLVQEGFDVYAIDLRGRGLSSKPNGRRGRPLNENWTFDDYVQFDLPAVIKYVRRLTGSKKAHWVGHSMGGMVIYPYLQNHPDGGGLASATAVASPGNMVHTDFTNPVAKAGSLLLRGKIIPSKQLARFFGPFALLIPFERFGVKRRHYIWLAVNCVSNTSTGVARQFHHWIVNKTFCNKDGSEIYAENYGKIKTPLLTMVGSRDFLAHPRDVLFVAENLEGSRHKHVYFSKKKGSIGSYNHESILMGETAPKEVYPIITDWLRKHSSVK